MIVGANPQNTVLDPATHTLYALSDPENNTDGSVSVLNASTCNAVRASGCGSNTPSVQVGNGPVAIAVDQATDTIYVVNSNGNTVSVIDGATCNATTTAGCRRKPPSVTVGTGSVNYNVAFAIDQATNTLYVANWRDNTLSMIDTATCDAAVTSGCVKTPRAVRVGSGPDGVTLNLATHTVYVSNVTSDTVSVLDAASCNASVNSGCGTRPSRSLRTGHSPRWITVDQATDTVYVPNGDDGTMSVLNGATCNAAASSGCS